MTPTLAILPSEESFLALMKVLMMNEPIFMISISIFYEDFNNFMKPNDLLIFLDES